MSPRLDNHSPFPALIVRKYGHRLRPFHVLVVRGTFDLQPGRRATPCDEQEPIVMADTYAASPPEKSYLTAETDLVLGKKTTDVVVRARAYSPEGKPASRFLAALQVGPVQKTLSITGPRRWEQRTIGWQLSDPGKITDLPLTYDNAFGGAYTLNDVKGLPSLGTDNHLGYPANGAGRGWLPTAAEIKKRFGDRLKDGDAREWARAIELSWTRAGAVPAHQIEDPRRPVTSLDARPDPEGCLPLARFWRQRVQYAGTYDEAWRRDVWPSLPDDFDFRFYQHAHPDLVTPEYLVGDEVWGTSGLVPGGGTLTGKLPAFQLFTVSADEARIAEKRDMRLDTVVLDLESNKLYLTWRYAFAEELGITRIVLAAMVPPPEARGERLIQIGRPGGFHG